MKLFGSYTSPYVRHCRIVLALQQQPYQFIITDQQASGQHSPTYRVPFLQHNEQTFYDSASIVRYLREQAGQAFCQDAADYDLFCMVNTALDTTINLFLLERDGLTAEHSAYLQRQQQRIEAILALLNQRTWSLPEQPEQLSDGLLRLACYLSWAQFRQQIDILHYPNLQQFLLALNGQPWFANTHPALS